MEEEFNKLEQNFNNKLVLCDSSAVFLFSTIYPMLVKGADLESIRAKIMSAGSSVVEEYFRGAVGLLLLAIDKQIKLLVDPVCLKELCIDGDKYHKRFISFLFKQGLFDLIWPIDPHDCTEKVRKRVSEYTKKVGAIRRFETYSRLRGKYIDKDLGDKLSCSEVDYAFEHGGIILNLYCPNKPGVANGHSLDEIKEIIVDQYRAEAKQTNNLPINLRPNIEFKDQDLKFLPHQIVMHVHRNNQDFGDEITQPNLFDQINEVSKVRVYSLGDAYRRSNAIKQAYDTFAGKHIEVVPVIPPFSVEPTDEIGLVRQTYLRGELYDGLDFKQDVTQTTKQAEEDPLDSEPRDGIKLDD